MTILTHNAHDKFFKDTWSRKEFARDYLENYLPPALAEHLDLASLTLAKDSFIDHTFKEQFSDLVYQVTLTNGTNAFVYLLYEHKSYRDPLTYFQLLKNTVRLWEKEEKQKKLPPLPIVIPLIIYHAQEAWQLSYEFSALYGEVDAAFLPYLPQFQIIFTDISHLDDDALKGKAFNRAAYLLFKYLRDKDFLEHLPDILRLFRHRQDNLGLDFLFAVLKYIASASDKLDEAGLQQAMQQALPDTGDQLMATLAEKWYSDGREEGIEKGIEKGREEGERNLFKQLIQRRYDIDILPAWAEQEVDAASKAQIESWTAKLFDTSLLEDLLK